VFAINNIEFDIWTLVWFGILGFLMRHFGFPLAPMILGVVLGNIAELNLARAMAITTDISPFFTRPWSLFFFTIAIFPPSSPCSRGTGAKRNGLFSTCRWRVSPYPCPFT
jgi:putative tricarboxylic transport membrane protein